MIMGIGVGALSLGFMHLVTHAWFKACLFLASGSVIHAMHHSMHHQHDHHTDPQDIRNMGGLRKTMPITYYCFLFACIAIAGIPLTSGFLSKDGILAGTMAFGNLSGHLFIPIAGFSAAFMTAFYMFRLCIEAFHGKPKTEIAKQTHENKSVIVFPLILLAGLSFWFFYSLSPLDATKGWFLEKVKTPENIVPAQYQFDFITPLNERKYEYPCAVAIEYNDNEYGNIDYIVSERRNGFVFVVEKDSEIKRTATPEEIQQFVKDFNEDGGSYEGKKLAVSSTGKVIVDNGYEVVEHSEHQALNKFEEEAHHQHTSAMLLSLLVAGCGILLAFVVYQWKKINAGKVSEAIKPLYKLSFNKWYIDEIYEKTFIGGTMLLSKLLSLFDNKIVDGLVNFTAKITNIWGFIVGKFDNLVVDGAVNLLAWKVGFWGKIGRKMQTGTVQTYIAFSIIILMIIAYFVV
jgi:NADH-quinone oxidoreductase subunit L